MVLGDLAKINVALKGFDASKLEKFTDLQAYIKMLKELQVELEEAFKIGDELNKIVAKEKQEIKEGDNLNSVLSKNKAYNNFLEGYSELMEKEVEFDCVFLSRLLKKHYKDLKLDSDLLLSLSDKGVL